MMSKLENRWQRVPFYIVLHSRTTPKGEQISCLTTAASATTTTNDTVIIDIMLALAGHDSKQHALKTKKKKSHIKTWLLSNQQITIYYSCLTIRGLDRFSCLTWLLPTNAIVPAFCFFFFFFFCLCSQKDLSGHVITHVIIAWTGWM